MQVVRRAPRVAYESAIHLQLPEGGLDIEGKAGNLSLGGCFVAMTTPPALGTQIKVRLALGGEERTLKGKVAWRRAAPDAEPGAGIRFTELSREDSALLADLLTPDLHDKQSVELWFDGQAHPVVGRVSVRNGGLQIAAKLPFLRLKAPVTLSFKDDGAEKLRAATLDSVTFEIDGKDGVPRLRLDLAAPLPGKLFGAGLAGVEPVAPTANPRGRADRAKLATSASSSFWVEDEASDEADRRPWDLSQEIRLPWRDRARVIAERFVQRASAWKREAIAAVVAGLVVFGVAYALQGRHVPAVPTPLEAGPAPQGIVVQPIPGK